MKSLFSTGWPSCDTGPMSARSISTPPARTMYWLTACMTASAAVLLPWSSTRRIYAGPRTKRVNKATTRNFQRDERGTDVNHALPIRIAPRSHRRCCRDSGNIRTVSGAGAGARPDRGGRAACAHVRGDAGPGPLRLPAPAHGAASRARRADQDRGARFLVDLWGGREHVGGCLSEPAGGGAREAFSRTRNHGAEPRRERRGNH